MIIRIGYNMTFEVPAPVVFHFLLYVLPTRTADLLDSDSIKITPSLKITEFVDAFGNRAASVLVPAGTLRVQSESLIQDSGLPTPVKLNAEQHAIQDLPTATYQFLLPSRYCESDVLGAAAWKLFGDTPEGWPRVQAVCDWVFANVEFGYHHASQAKTASDIYRDRKGVCRDFTHLSIAFCRALNIPARYATGYLGDIGVPPADSAMDFSACFQVYLGGEWHTFDPRHNEHRIGWVLMAVGRDAADCAITTSYGPHTMGEFTVIADEVKS